MPRNTQRPAALASLEELCSNQDCKNEGAVPYPLCREAMCIHCLTAKKGNRMQVLKHLHSCSCINTIMLMGGSVEDCDKDSLLSEEGIESCYESWPTPDEGGEQGNPIATCFVI
jgi:hypothetical protein